VNTLIQDKAAQLSQAVAENKNKILMEAFGFKESYNIQEAFEFISQYKNKLSCRVNYEGVETYFYEDFPMVEIYPLQTSFEDGILTTTQNYKVLWK
jgi:hypothetical protein